MNTNSAQTFEDAEQALTADVIANVRRELAGRDGSDLVDVQPSRTIFAGVLQPPRARATHVPRTGSVARDMPDGTAIGLDFRVRPQEGARPALRITAEWAHYYPVFPSFDQVLETADLPPSPAPPQDVPDAADRSTGSEDP